MSKTSKVILTIVVVAIFVPCFATTVGIGQSAGQKGGGLLGIILMAVTIAALRSIWKSRKKG